MSLHFSHSIHYVHNLDDVARQFSHYGLALQNKSQDALTSASAFLSPYVEFFSLNKQENNDRNFLKQEANLYLPVQQIFGRIALSTSHLEELKHRFKKAGHKISAPISGKHSNGTKWQGFTILTDYNHLLYPLFIDQKSSVTKQEAPTLKNIYFRVENPQSVCEHWQEILHLKPLYIKGKQALQIDNFHLIFEKGKINRLHSLEFEATDWPVSQTEFRIGQGFYRFN
ncbi:VOC family protein [Listeria sp. PSOL-1]|uniref:VOC family protein n=1 Tax=Listeria sp. PSOL-1 TaxID=1844999 RepID=UPI0013D38381|nr:VOC family protein [Listeria sp. PSOL-1]